MARYIDADALWEKTKKLEDEALAEVLKHPDRTTEFSVWNAAFVERISFRHDIEDAPTVEFPKAKHECNDCKYYEGVRCPGHAPCSFWHIGAVMWNDYCSRWEKKKTCDNCKNAWVYCHPRDGRSCFSWEEKEAEQ